MKLLAAIPLVILLSPVGSEHAGAAGSAPADAIIRGGIVIDGSGAKGRRADVVIAGGRIVRVGNAAGFESVQVIEARGLAVAPGFIDVHTHADRLADQPLAENYIRMGVTSIVAGNCGDSTVDIGEAYRRIRATGPSVNFATLIGHNSIRAQVLGNERRAPTASELSRMKELVVRAMAEGAVGLSTGLQYVPGVYASPEEIIELARVAADAGGIYASHMRNEGTDIERALAEALRVGEATGCAVEVSHLKIDSPRRWGNAPRVLAMLEAARRRGIVVLADQYAYTAASAGLSIRFPAWALEGTPAQVKSRLDDAQTWERIRRGMQALLSERGFQDLSFAVVASYPPETSFNGLSIRDIALKLRGDASSGTQLEVARDMMRSGGADMVYHLMSEDDLRRIMKDRHVAVASDSSLIAPGSGKPHPRGSGNNARVLGRYVRELRILSLEEAVRRMTSLPAQQFRLAERGFVRPGYAADIVLFDPKDVSDTATYSEPRGVPNGIPHVMVNGVFVVRDGKVTGARPGQILRQLPRRRGLARPVTK